MAGQQNSSEVLQSLLNQIQVPKQAEGKSKEVIEETEQEVDEEGKTALSGNQDALREQLKSLLNSGLIKIRTFDLKFP